MKEGGNEQGRAGHCTQPPQQLGERHSGHCHFIAEFG
jgi:hypothetical protein